MTARERIRDIDNAFLCGVGFGVSLGYLLRLIVEAILG